jgi:Dyp-type peroxidase family
MALNDGDDKLDCSEPAFKADSSNAPSACPAASAAATSSALLSTARDQRAVRKTRHLQGISDLTLLAPLKSGLIPALDARTYETRARLLLKSLHSLRATSREYSLLRPFVDTAARIRTIHSLRLAIIDDQHPAPARSLLGRNSLLLAVTFDQPWEPYIRSIWDDVGALLDVIFCNCEDYPLASQHSFEEYMRWVRSVQVETNFFFSSSSMTVDDLQYLKQVEQIQREAAPGFELRAAQETLKSPQQLAQAVCSAPANQSEIIRQGLLALAALHRLVDMYTPQADGDTLLRAAHELLKGLPTRQLPEVIRTRFAAQLQWFERELPKPPRPAPAIVELPREEIQGGILNELHDTHSCLLLFAIDDATQAASYLAKLRPRITLEGSPCDGLHLNVALTYQGLCQLGLHDHELQKFSAEFREGMAARAGLLGDVRCNHPRNWHLPLRNWPDAPATGSIVPPLELSMVHLVIRLGVQGAAVEYAIQDPRHPLHAHIVDLAQAQGLSLLSVEAAMRHESGHFGYADGLSQPAVNQGPQGRVWPNHVPLGDVLLGHPNRFDFAKHDPLLDNGSYLVVRKLRQDVQLFHDRMEQQSRQLGVAADVLKAKLMGRTLSGAALANPSTPTSNDFDYQHDGKGTLCPFAAHVRRANPRTADTPRIVRRGMSYGPRFDPQAPSAAERGVYFMAYNASLAEQFEVVQRWVSGGNSTGVYSGESDPFLGVPESGQPRTFRFQHTVDHATVPLHIELTDATQRPFVTLEWGLYLFVPSLSGLATLIAQARRTHDAPDVAAGEELVQQLLAGDRKRSQQGVDRWKTVLEDFESRICGTAANVWAAIRERHGGVLRTSYGVLVCSRSLLLEVLANSQRRYTATDYLKRMDASLGKIYLGRDAGAEYDREARATNAAIQLITGQEAFDSAYRYTTGALQEFIKVTRQLSAQARLSTWELTLDLKELSDIVLAKLCLEWFDIPDGKHIQPGGWRWDWQPPAAPLCPGHFTAPSRYTFQPRPGVTPQHYGELHGQALRAAMNEFVKERRARPDSLRGRLSRAMFAAFPAAKDNDLLARNLVGVMMGFLPAADGNLRGTLYEWIEHRTLWEVQQAYLASAAPAQYQRAIGSILQPLMNTMRLRPTPELIWRTAKVAHQLGDVAIKPKDRIVLAIVAATQEDRLNGNAQDVYPIFGGNRREAPERPHACPAYDSGMGVLLGIIAALCASGPMRPTPAPLTLSFSGSLD